MTGGETVAAFLDAMAAQGVVAIEPIGAALASGELTRFRAQGDRPGRRNGWAKLYLDGVPAGAFGHYRAGVRATWRAGGDPRALTPPERRSIAASIRAIEAQRTRDTAARHDEAARYAASLWNGANAAPALHLYTARKGIAATGARERRGELLIPIVDATFRLRNVQRIARDGSKRFVKGGATAGLFWMHGGTSGPVIVGEGWATMAAIWAALDGCAVVAAMTAANVRTVAETMRKLYPSRPLLIAADDDFGGVRNAGIEAAQAASRATGATIVTPWPLDWPDRLAADFADLTPDATRARFAEALNG